MYNAHNQTKASIVKLLVVTIGLIMTLSILSACLPNGGNTDESEIISIENTVETRSGFEKLIDLGNVLSKASFAMLYIYVLGLLAVALVLAIVIMAKKL